MHFHPEKCKILQIHNNELLCIKFLPLAKHHYFINGELIKFTECQRDLGVLINSRFKWDDHQQKVLNKARQMLGITKRTCHYIVDRRKRRSLYLSLVRSQFEHCSSIWRPNTDTEMSLTHLADHLFTKVFFTKSYILGTDCHFTYGVFRTNLSLNTKSPIFYGANYLIVLELAFLHFNFKTHMYINDHVLKNVYHVEFYISYRVTGLYRLGKKCYLHSLLCKMILFQFAHEKMIAQPTLTPPQTRDWWRAIVCAEIVSRWHHMTKQLGEYWHTTCRATVVILPMNWLVDCARTISTW